MKILYEISLFLVLITVNSYSYDNFWIKTNGPYGSNIHSIAHDEISGNIYLATLSDGVYYSKDGGNNWRSLNDDVLLKNTKVNDIFVETNGEVLAITDSLGILKKSGNLRWTAINSGFGGHLSFFSFLKIDDKTYLAGSNGKAIFKSINGGESWVNYNDGLNAEEIINSIVLVENKIFIGTGAGIYKSVDGGRKWTIINGINEAVNCIKYINDRNLVIAGTINGIYLSSDQGEHWENINKNLPLNPNILSLVEHDEKLYIGTSNQGLYYCDFDTFSWNKFTNGVSSEKIQYLININNTLFAGTHFNLLKLSSDTFINSITGLGVRSVNRFLDFDNNLYSATDMGVYKSSNLGSSWIQMNNGFKDIIEMNTIIKADDGTMLAGTNGDGLYYSTDNGQYWIKNNNPDLTSIRISKLVIDSSGIIYAGTKGKGIFKSEDNGLSWIQMFGEGVEKTEILALIVSKNNYIYAGTLNEGLYLKTPLDEWRKSFIELGVQTVHSIEYIPENTESAIMAGTNIGIIRSQDDGVFWFKTNGLLMSPAETLYFDGDSTIYTGLKNQFGVYHSKNNGDEWLRTIDNSGIFNYQVTTFIRSGFGFMFAGTRSGGSYRSILSNTNTLPNYPKLSVLGETSFCDGYFCVLDAGENWTEYNWSDGAFTRFDTVWQEGDYFVTVKDPLGIEIISDTVKVNVNSKPLEPRIFFNGEILFCNIEAARYQWYYDDELLAGETSKTLDPQLEGWYKCEVFTEFDCENISEAYNVIFPQGVNEYQPALSIFPNPVDDVLILKVNKTLEPITEMKIYNILGEIVLEKHLKSSPSDNLQSEIKFDMSTFPSGLYYYQIQNDNNSYAGKFIKN